MARKKKKKNQKLAEKLKELPIARELKSVEKAILCGGSFYPNPEIYIARTRP
ncbi:MAG: hypothetical protein KC777_27955 [Cyanobacteria bacterium HKST-UBA02]|nr:hypothetical protein [Cyanobacteria bacterium HKST-UBA02]